MKRQLEKLHARPIHERREFAVHAAAGVIALVGLVWLSTLGVRLAATVPQTTVAANESAASLVAATAAASQAFQSQMQDGTIQSTGQADGSDAQTTGTASDTPQTAPATVLGVPDDPAAVLTQ